MFILQKEACVGSWALNRIAASGFSGNISIHIIEFYIYTILEFIQFWIYTIIELYNLLTVQVHKYSRSKNKVESDSWMLNVESWICKMENRMWISEFRFRNGVLHVHRERNIGTVARPEPTYSKHSHQPCIYEHKINLSLKFQHEIARFPAIA